jgi:predicted dehydrogenase
VKKIRAGIIGSGMMGPIHTEALRRLGYVDVVALAEVNDDLAKAKSVQLHIEKAYGDYTKLIADPEIDVVHNCTPNQVHFEVSKAIMKAGKHVVSEKPLAMNSTQSKELVALAKSSGVVNAIDFNYRNYPLVQQMRAMVKKGELGKIYLIHGSYLQDWLYLETDYNWRIEPANGGESRAVGDVGSHWFDTVQHITGEHVTEVMANLKIIHKNRKKPKKAVETYAGKMLKPEDYADVPVSTEDAATIMFRTSSGATGACVISQVSAGRKNRMYFEIDGSKCAVEFDQEEPNQMWIGRREKANEWLHKDASLMHPEARPFSHYPGGHPEGYSEGPRNLFGLVYKYIADGATGAPTFSTFQDGHNEIVICEAVLESHKKQAWTKVVY